MRRARSEGAGPKDDGGGAARGGAGEALCTGNSPDWHFSKLGDGKIKTRSALLRSNS